jgi:hypothetical protein
MRAQTYFSIVYFKNYLLQQFWAYLHSDLLTNYVAHSIKIQFSLFHIS